MNFLFCLLLICLGYFYCFLYGINYIYLTGVCKVLRLIKRAQLYMGQETREGEEVVPRVLHWQEGGRTPKMGRHVGISSITRYLSFLETPAEELLQKWSKFISLSAPAMQSRLVINFKYRRKGNISQIHWCQPRQKCTVQAVGFISARHCLCSMSTCRRSVIHPVLKCSACNNLTFFKMFSGT